MAEASWGSHEGGPLGDPPESTPGTRVPNWLLNRDEIGYQTVLVMQVRREQESGSKENSVSNIRLPSPFVIGASIEQAIGKEKARKIEASKEGRGTKYLLRTESRSTVEKLLTITKLVDGTLVEVLEHSTLNSVQGVVYELDSIDDKEEDILKSLKWQGVTNVRRIRKRVNNVLRNTPLLVLSLKGAVLPQFIYFGVLRVPMRTYYPSPLLCYNCGIYGHPKKVCKEISICLRCSQEVHVADGEQCQNPAFCLHCKANHPVTSRDCPKYQQEAKIIQHKIDNRISFGEARRALRERCGDTYASVLQHRLRQVETEKDTTINMLRKELEAVKAELQLLKGPPQTNQEQEENMHRTAIQSCKITSKQTETVMQANNIPNQPTPSSGNTNGRRINEHHDTGRKSRKDKASISPPKDRQHRKNNSKHRMELRSRSRSDKRMNTSPPDSDRDLKGKRRHLANDDVYK